ncbi:sugar ABC transporter ATP-binding protein [Agathobaculum sp.]|uniref:sugar ABC transporter ATP-binding protein n=1 Tax=Agathobaculum sp. TaxID=2048138 RepID=UPI002A817114|nr:sugar ABC transporter ATP-binding protein [Agathobaculum sp.]MDY3617982.1 sugar ABC transporter ATP-binding protein [Agathobaculum sp.]
MSEFILEMNHIAKSFPGVKVLDDVTFQVRPGEVHALMGENGAGKSTLMKILMGIYTADAGEVVLDGQPLVARNPRDAMDKGVSMIHQELNPILDMQVFENIYIGRECKKGLLVDKKRMVEETTKLLRDLGIDISATAYMRELSVAQCQLIEIVKAISLSSKVVVMDEPTSAITDREVETLFQQIRRLKSENVAVIYISHKMDEIFQICDTITVLRDGKFIGTDAAANMTNDQLIRMMVGRDITDVFPKTEAQIGEIVLEVKDLSLGRHVRHVNFSLRRGEVLGIAGLVGAGRSELVETIFGMRHKTEGEIFVNGQPVNITHPRHAIAHKIALITEDRKFTGLNLVGTVAENITLVDLAHLFPAGLIDRKKENKVSDHYIQELSIKTPSAQQLVGNLSGGNQQKVVIAKWLLSDPDIIILDEPTRGIDVGAKRDIYLLIGELVKNGKAVIVISSEIPEVMGLSDRIIVMAEGRLTGEIDRKNFSQERIMTFAAQFGE